MKSLLAIALMSIGLAQAAPGDLMILQPLDLDLRTTCEKYPGSCNSAPIIVQPVQPVQVQPQVKPTAATKCIYNFLYFEVEDQKGGPSIWKPVRIEGKTVYCN